MAKVTLIGVRNLDFTADDGKVIQGVKIFFAHDDPNVEGQVTENKFISSASCDKMGLTYGSLCSCIGSILDVDVDFNGKIIGIFEANWIESSKY